MYALGGIGAHTLFWALRWAYGRQIGSNEVNGDGLPSDKGRSGVEVAVARLSCCLTYIRLSYPHPYLSYTISFPCSLSAARWEHT